MIFNKFLFQMMNQTDLAKELDLLNDALEVIDNFTEHYNVNLDAFNPKHYDDNTLLSNSKNLIPQTF